jgi:hypothetical protein
MLAFTRKNLNRASRVFSRIEHTAVNISIKYVSKYYETLFKKVENKL